MKFEIKMNDSDYPEDFEVSAKNNMKTMSSKLNSDMFKSSNFVHIIKEGE